MSLLPKSSKEFSSTQYWDEFFGKRGSKAFEWYGEYAELCGYFHKYIKPSDTILVAGCGNSTMSADLYKFGFRNITNIDISKIVIKQMKEKYENECKEMKWIHGDLFELSYEQESFSCVLDKGTLDALMSESTEEAATQANLYFQQIGNVLRVGGRFICISLLQEHILTALLEWFPANGWFMRFCRCEDAEKTQSSRGSFTFPVFVIICTKFKSMNNFKSIIELNIEDGVLKRVAASEVRECVTSLQHFALLRHNLQNKLSVNEEINLDLYDHKTGKTRFSLFVVDSPKTSNRLLFAAFIVPHGRETEWLFKTKKGQLQLAESASTNRLIVVHLMRNQIYGTIEDVQKELSLKVLELAPPKLPNSYKIPFLSVGDDLGERKEVFRGRSVYSGEFIVEDIKDDSSNCYFRRLVFLHNQNLIQSEAKLISKKKKKKKNETDSCCTLIDPSYLACSDHKVMLMAFEMSLPRHSSEALLIGLGGGALATYIHNYFPNVSLAAIDVDQAIVDIATNWFNFKADSRLTCEIADGVQFIKEASIEGRKYDVIICDVDSKELSEGLSCPSKQFLEMAFLQNLVNCLNENGTFTINLVCRDAELKKIVKKDLKKLFPVVFSVSVSEEVNEVIFCRSRTSSQRLKEEFEKKVISLNHYLKLQTKHTQNVLDLNEVIKNFQTL